MSTKPFVADWVLDDDDLDEEVITEVFVRAPELQRPAAPCDHCGGTGRTGDSEPPRPRVVEPASGIMRVSAP
jgi:hypothetical protein